MTQDSLVARDGARLPMTHWPAEGSPASASGPVVLALHSFGDYRAAFSDLGLVLASRGMTVYAYDQRGFGEAPHPGRWAGHAALVGDATDAIAVLGRRYPERPILLLGESMGAAVALIAANRLNAGQTVGEPPVAGVIAAAPAVREGIPMRRLWDFALASAATLAPAASVHVDRDTNPDLSASAARRLAEDPLVVRDVRADSYFGLIRLADAASDTLGPARVPTRILYGSDDSTVREISICHLLDRLGPQAEGLVFRGAPHLVLQMDDQDALVTLIEAMAQDRARPLSDIAADWQRFPPQSTNHRC